MIVAVIPARKGSKGIERKNVCEINGKPLVEWSIEAAMRCAYVDHVVVSSNDEEVERIVAEQTWNDGRLHFLRRPEEISGDTVKTEEALFHAVDWLVNDRDLIPDWIMTLQPTSPVRNDHLLDKCCERVLSPGVHFDSLVTCSAHTPFFYTVNGRGDAIPLDHNPCHRPMRQSISEWEMYYHDNGNCYLTRAERLLRFQCRTGKYCALMPLTKYQSWQIDDHEDFAILESMSRSLGPFI